MGAAVERAAIPATAAAILFSALCFSDGTQLGPLVWIGGAALVAAALAAVAVALAGLPAARLDGAALGFLGCLAGLAAWSGISVVWSIEPSNSWQFTNRLVVYLAFAVLGVLAAPLLPRAPRLLADGLTVLLALVLGWALLAKIVPGLYPDYARIARLRSPVEYWNALALLGVVAVPLGLRLAAPRTRAVAVRAAAVAFLYVAILVVLLTYSRAGIGLAVAAAAVWLALERDRVESALALALAGGSAAGVFVFALSLPGITEDGVTRAQRAHDGWRFALALALVGAALTAVAAMAARYERRRPLSPGLRSRIDRALLWAVAAVVAAAVVVAGVLAGRLWRDFSAGGQVTNQPGHLTTLGSGNRWAWWQEAWHAFTRHPFGGTGAGTFDLTNTLHRTNPFNVAVEPHNVPLQLLSETGIVGLLLYLGAAAAAAVGIVRARRRTGDAAVTALGLGLAVWFLHMLVDIDWSFVAVCGPLLFVTGALLASEPRPRTVERRLALPALGGLALALVAVYSLAAPWLAVRELNGAVDAALSDPQQALARVKTAHSYDPLSTDVLLTWASLETPERALTLYRKALALEPLNPTVWYELGAFEWQRGNWEASYLALDRSWGLDRLDPPLSLRCSLLDRVRRKVKDYGPICPPLAPGARP